MQHLIDTLRHALAPGHPIDPAAPLHLAMLQHAELPSGSTPADALHRLKHHVPRTMAEATLLGLARAYWAALDNNPPASHPPPAKAVAMPPLPRPPGFRILRPEQARPEAEGTRSDLLERLAAPLAVADGVPLAALAGLDVAFPWFAEATELIAKQTRLAAALGAARPTLPALLLIGPPGIGKSRYAAALAAALGRKLVSQPMAGLGDAFTIAGTHPSFQTARPGLPVRAVLETGCADPVILLDELDRAAASVQHGDPLDALLPLLEPGTAARYRDAFLDRELDLSLLSWIATANAAGGLSGALLSRLQSVVATGPGPEHFDAVLARFRMDMAARVACDAAMIPEPTELDRAALAAMLRRSPDLRLLERSWRIRVEQRLLAGVE